MSTSARSPAPAARRRPLFFYGYWIMGAALTAQFISVGSQMSVAGVFLTPMQDDLGWTRAEFTYAQTVGRFIMAFVGFMVGARIDRHGARPLMLIGATVTAGALLLTAEVTEIWQWLVLRGVVFTVGAAMIGNLVVNVTLSKWFVEKRGRVIGIAAMGVSLAGTVMPPLMTALVDEFGWRTGWRVLALAALLLIYPAALVMRRQPEDYGLHPDGKSDAEMAGGGGERARADFENSLTRGEALRTPTLYMIIVAFGLANVGLGAILLHSIPFVTDAGFSRGTAALMFSAMSFPALISKPVWGLLIEKSEPKFFAAAGFAMSGVSMVVIVIAANGGSVELLTFGYLLMGFGFGGIIPIQEMIWASYFGRRHLGAVRSVAMPFSLVIGAGAPLGVSAYFDAVGNYDGVFYTISALWVLAAFMVMLVRKPAAPDRLRVSEAEGELLEPAVTPGGG